MRAPVVPLGVQALAERLWKHAGHDADPARIDRMLHAPLSLEPDWPPPVRPLPVGEGFVHSEVIDDDFELLHELIGSVGHRGPEALACAAQELRLPVTPYRRIPGGPRNQPSAPTSDLNGLAKADPAAASGKLVLDLTTHWAGPLATSLLADAGATVIKVDPDVRPDGFRERPRLYKELNGTKDIIDLDLRTDEDRGRFETLVAEADLLVESFSRRVMSNFGYGPDRLLAISPTLSQLSLKAHPLGTPEQDWLGYGPAIHAISGLAFADEAPTPAQAPTPARLPYPDLLAALAAYRRALLLLAGEVSDADGCAAEVSLRGSVQPLVDALRVQDSEASS